MKFIKTWWPIMLLAVIGATMLIPITMSPPGSTRVVVDHTLETYIAPLCFDEAEATNHLGEVTWERVSDYGYKPESACTETQLAPQTMLLWQSLAIRLGLINGPWSW